MGGNIVYRGTPPTYLNALRFPSNVSGSDTAAPYAVIKKANPQSDGFPFWGPGNVGWTIIRQSIPRQQTGYYAQGWWSRDDAAFSGNADSPYAGFHPYPKSQNNSGTTHCWEVAAEAGDFFTSGGSGDPTLGATVVQGQTYLQAFRGIFSGKLLRMYHNLPNVGSSNYIEWALGSSYGTSLNGGVSAWAYTIGDSPWYATFQHERASMDLIAIKIIMGAMTESDILLESADMSRLVTAAAISGIWWGKYGFDTVNDLTCDFGTGRSFTKVDASNQLSVVSV